MNIPTTFLDSIAAPIVILGADSRIVQFNSAFARISAHPADGGFEGRHLWELLPEGPGASELHQLCEQVRDEDRAGPVLTYWPTKDGRLLIQWSRSTLTSPEGRPKWTVCTGVDITRLARTEGALRQSEHHLRSVVANTPVILFALDREGRFTLSEGRGLAALGLKPSEVVGRSVFDMYADDRLITNNVRRALAGDTFSCRVGGGGRWFEVWYSPLRDDGAQITGAIGVAVDVTEEREAEAILRRRLGLETLVASISTRFINLAPDEIDQGISDALGETGEFAGVDRSYVFQFSEDATATSNTHEWCALGIEPQIGNLQQLPTAAFPWWMDKLRRFETIHLPRLSDLPPEAGAERDILSSQGIQSLVVVPMTSHGRLMGFLGFDSVRTEKTWQEDDFALLETLAGVLVSGLERKRIAEEHGRLEEQLRHAQKMEAIGRLAGGIAHDFNNLLTVILGHAAILSDSVHEHGLPDTDAEQIQHAAERAVALTRQLLAFSRKQILKPRVLDLNSAVRNVETMLRRVIGENVELITELDPASGRIRADLGQIEQVLLNLAVNARDAMPHGGKLVLRTMHAGRRIGLPAECAARPEPYVLLEVSDTGCGMDPDTLAHIFEPFFTTKGLGHGTGMGLATVYGIVEQHGGHIRVNSEAGRGTRFEIYLPSVKEESATSAGVSLPQSAALRGTETILLVEDDANVRSLVRRVLAQSGYTVLEAAGSEEALLIAERRDGPIHLLLTDVVLPRSSGRELAEALTASRPGTKVLFVSGYASEVFPSGEIADDRATFLQKPFTPEELNRKLRDLLDSAAA